MRILFLSRWNPYPPDNGSKIRIYNILRRLSEQHEVALAAFTDATDHDCGPSRAALREFCSRVDAVNYREFRPSRLHARLGFFSRQPRSLVDTYSPEMANTIQRLGLEFAPDVVIASQLQMVPYAREISGIPVVLEELELTTFWDAWRRGRSAAAKWRAGLTWFKLATYLRRALPRFAACTVVSEAERDLVRLVVPAYDRVSVIPNALDLTRYEGNFGVPKPDSLIFSGALTYKANLDALTYLLAEIYPLLRRSVPDVELRVTGDNRGVNIASLPNASGVQFTGYLDDIRPAVAQSWGAVVPLRIGGGTRLKILEAMALGTPVVSTTKGAEGLEVTDGEEILLAQDFSQFARKTIALLQSPTLRDRLSRRAQLLVARKYDWRVVGEALGSLIERIGPDCVLERASSG